MASGRGVAGDPVLGWWRVLQLGYLFFVYLPFWFVPVIDRQVLGASVAATALFLPVYFASYRAEGWQRPVAVAAIAAIGLALIPLNTGGNAFLIYAMSASAFCLSPRAALASCAAICLLLAAELEWLGQPQFHLAIAVVVGVPAVASALLGRAAQRRNAALLLSQAEVRRLAQAGERERIGRDLHDLLGHTLSLIALKSELAGRLLDRDRGDARGQIGDVEKVARDALGEVRRAVSGMRAVRLEAELVQARLALLTGEAALDSRMTQLDLSPEAETALALGLREAVTNVLRHARAGKVEVELQADGAGALLAIRDDGSGGPIKPGEGLSGMRERLSAVGGSLEIESTPQAGTRLLLRVPVAGATLGR